MDLKSRKMLYNVGFVLGIIGILLHILHSYISYRNNDRHYILLVISILAFVSALTRIPLMFKKSKMGWHYMIKLPLKFFAIMGYLLIFIH